MLSIAICLGLGLDKPIHRSAGLELRLETRTGKDQLELRVQLRWTGEKNIWRLQSIEQLDVGIADAAMSKVTTHDIKLTAAFLFRQDDCVEYVIKLPKDFKTPAGVRVGFGYLHCYKLIVAPE
jgi:hypothetical protein